jgi:hypothetical protein
MGAVVEPVEHLKELDYVDLFNAFAGPARIPPSKKAKKNAYLDLSHACVLLKESFRPTISASRTLQRRAQSSSITP